MADATASDNVTAEEEVALRLMLQKHRERLLRYVERHLPRGLRSYFDPADVLQDTYFEAFRRIHLFRADDEDADVRWLLTIARNRIVHLMRAHKSLKRHKHATTSLSAAVHDNDLLVAFLGELAVYHRTPSQSAASREFFAELEMSLLRLQPDYSQIIRLRHVEGLSVKEAAEKMDRTEGAVSVLCNRALKALRVEMRSASLFV